MPDKHLFSGRRGRLIAQSAMRVRVQSARLIGQTDRRPVTPGPSPSMSHQCPMRDPENETATYDSS